MAFTTSWFLSKQHRPSKALPIALTPDDEIPRYPPFLKGLPGASVSRLLSDQAELVDRMRLSSGAGEEKWVRWYAPAIARYAEHVHLLPASQSHHHRGAGGLLRHGLEVAFQSMRLLDATLVAGDEEATARRAAMPRWQYAAFLGGLLHDCAKPITDLTVTDRAGTQTWNPFAMTLAEWLAHHQMDRYFLHWRAARRDKHTMAGAIVAPFLIGQEALAWLTTDGPDLLRLLAESLVGIDWGANVIRDTVMRADAWSVQKDVQTLGAATPDDTEIGVPVERYILDTMRRLIRDGAWKVNQTGAHAWKMAGALYLVWPRCGRDAIEALKGDGMPGIPSDPDRVATLLIERGLAVANTTVTETPSAENVFYKIAPHLPGEKNKDPVWMRGLRLRDPELLIDPAPADVAGAITENSAEKTGLAAPLPPAIPSPASSPAGLSLTPTAEPETAQSIRTLPHPEAAPPANTIGATSDPWAALRACGDAGPILVALAEDIGKGVKSRDSIGVVADGLALRYPQALENYGIPPLHVMEVLNAYIVPDAITPAKRVRMLTVGGTEHRVIVLREEIGALVMAAIASLPVNGLLPSPPVLPVSGTGALASFASWEALLWQESSNKARFSHVKRKKDGALYLATEEAARALAELTKGSITDIRPQLETIFPTGMIDKLSYIKLGPRETGKKDSR